MELLSHLAENLTDPLVLVLLLIAFCFGYGLRARMSRRRRQAARDRFHNAIGRRGILHDASTNQFKLKFPVDRGPLSPLQPD